MANDEVTRKEEENPELDDQVLEDVSGGEDLDTNNNNNNN
ncbi:MAG: hypothetical protein QOJ16_3693 [Acidobacteriota bacterium]|jgi:hypothetical protein|nr:hypothetical protein [Acidobacteriota bacterium]